MRAAVSGWLETAAATTAIDEVELVDARWFGDGRPAELVAELARVTRCTPRVVTAPVPRR